MSESSYFLILSSVEKLCIFKPKTSRLSSYLIHWNISDASLGTEELAHLEMIGAIVYQLTRNLTPEQIKAQGFDAYFVDFTTGVYPQSAGGTPFSAMAIASKGDPITDLTEDMAADGTTTKEQPVKTKCRKPLILLDFSAFSGCTSLTALQPYKDNKRLKSSKSYER